ncbi:hypothetical protein HDA45_004690 [Amycolatopsis umgeniensis]|uniref:Uncharacterized protein n=1 Tax=Amycolatopsis umgeniensis TaxID=336628 RepID=A0A841B6N4_9PSEU|nr:hypothetical protein [Amycolatopsis umgeniensis]
MRMTVDSARDAADAPSRAGSQRLERALDITV